MIRLFTLCVAVGVLVCAGCGDDTEADELGVGAECTATEQCDEDTDQECLMSFKGGYCGIVACTGNVDCPEASACVAHTDGMSYCFRICLDKAECNENRSVENESNCSGNITFVDADTSAKACVPPSAS